MSNLNRRKFIKQTAICAGGLPLGLSLRADNNNDLLNGVQNFLHNDRDMDGAAGAAEAGQVYCPRITSEHNADTTDLLRFRNFHKWKDKQNGDLAVTIYQYLCDYDTGIYHFYEMLDGKDPFFDFAIMREPLKMLNAYNMGFCGIFGATGEGIFNGVGFKTGRSFGLAAWSHNATEIFYDNAWHYFDVDLRGAVMKPDGTIASLEEVRTNKQLWVNSLGKIKPYFPHHSSNTEEISKVADIYARNYPAGVTLQYRWFQGSHTADYSLRPGESFTRWWDDKTGRWNHYPSYNKEQWVRNLINTPPVGMKPNHRDFTRWNHGGGLFHYEPKLTTGSGDLQAGALVVNGLKPGAEGLKLTAKSGSVIFNMFTPFPIVARINDLDNVDDDSEAVMITLDTAIPVTVDISTDNGITWQEAGKTKSGRTTLDATRIVKRAYGYQLKLSAAGKKSATAIRSLKVDTWVQVGPISLPRLMKGTNKLRYETGDRFDQATVPMLVIPNCGDPEDLRKYVVEMPTDYDPRRNQSRINGSVILKCQAPAGQKIVWLSAGGTFNAREGEGVSGNGNMMFYAVDEPKDFKEVYKASIPDWCDHWRYNYDTDIRLDKPAETVYVKYIGNPGVSVLRACLHLTLPRPADTLIRITHGYKLNAKDQEKTVEMDKPGEYTVDCDGEVENVFIRMEKPSVGRS